MALQLYSLVPKVLHLILLKYGEELGNDMNSTILIYLFVFPFRLKKLAHVPFRLNLNVIFTDNINTICHVAVRETVCAAGADV